jgi:hypothetical protein
LAVECQCLAGELLCLDRTPKGQFGFGPQIVEFGRLRELPRSVLQDFSSLLGTPQGQIGLSLQQERRARLFAGRIGVHQAVECRQTTFVLPMLTIELGRFDQDQARIGGQQ